MVTMNTAVRHPSQACVSFIIHATLFPISGELQSSPACTEHAAALTVWHTGRVDGPCIRLGVPGSTVIKLPGMLASGIIKCVEHRVLGASSGSLDLASPNVGG